MVVISSYGSHISSSRSRNQHTSLLLAKLFRPISVNIEIDYLLFIIYYLLFIIYYLLFIIYYLLKIISYAIYL